MTLQPGNLSFLIARRSATSISHTIPPGIALDHAHRRVHTREYGLASTLGLGSFCRAGLPLHRSKVRALRTWAAPTLGPRHEPRSLALVTTREVGKRNDD